MGAAGTFERIATDVAGLPVSDLWRGYGSAVFLELGTLSPGYVRSDGSPGNVRGEFTIRVEWSWRIENLKEIVCGSWSEEALWEPAFDFIRRSQVTSLTLSGRMPEIHLTLSRDWHFVSVTTAEGKPQCSMDDHGSSRASKCLAVCSRRAVV